VTTPLTVQSGFSDQKKPSRNGLPLTANFGIVNLVSLKQAETRVVVRMDTIAKVALIGMVLSRKSRKRSAN
jgi:hypothetical protein